MSSEILTLLGFGLVIVVIVGVIILIRIFSEQARVVGEIRSVMEQGGRVRENLSAHLEETRRTVESIRTENEARQRFDEATRDSIRRLEQVIAGTKSKGRAGENILREVLSSFPAEMVTNNFRIKGKEVEFALVLADKKVVPIDSKWPATELLELLEKEEDPHQRQRFVEQIEKEVKKRISEITQYIDPQVTTPWAVAVVPDAVFNLCRDAHSEAYKKNVILISYNLTVPYLLTLFNLHLQYSRSFDYDNIGTCLKEIQRHLKSMEEILENKIERAATMIDNASSEYRQIIGTLRGSLSSMESSSKKPKQKNK